MASLEAYVIITPARDEEKYIEKTIKSVINQTVLPAEWIIVDDGSSDSTAKIVQNYAQKFPWIKIFCRENRGKRKAGEGVMEAFYYGLEKITHFEWDYLVKLDADLILEKDYFEICFQHFKQNPRLGIGGGKVFNNINGKLKLEPHPRFHVRGATKIYRRKCWEEIEGLIKRTGWDTIDEVKANMRGWETYTFEEPILIHQRVTGGAEGTFRNYFKNGMGSFIIGYHPLFLFAKAISLIITSANFKAALGLLYGFV
ncbi:MAG: glycosyltransferase family 2 protein, partial [Desulfobacterota bacterium]|nr:glycosyltransferase family 2 protein [Thermodesulfobacteriota bacterium]